MLFSKYFFIFIFTIGFYKTMSAESSGFLVTVPKYILAGSKEKICISLHNRRSVLPVSLTLVSVNSDETITSAEDYIKGNASCLMIHVPLTNETKGKLRVQISGYGENDVPYFSEQNVKIKQDPLITIVATEKPLYRPGEVVRFRVLSLTHKLKVYNRKIQRVWIESPNGITLEQWLNVKTDLGLTQLEFPISDESLHGDWKIKIQRTNKSELIETKTFTVKEYVLPWFEVNIKQPKEILADAELVSFEICAKYSYGAPVSGNVELELRVKSKSHNEEQPNPKIIYETQLEPWTGCAVLNVTSGELSLPDETVVIEKVSVVATVTETASKKIERATAIIDVLDSALQLQFHCSEYFKPGLPYKGKLRVRSAGGHSNVPLDLPIQICMKEGAVYGTISKQCWNYSTDYSSEIVFTLPPRPNSTDSISLTAVSLNHPNKYYDDERWRLLMVQPKAKQNLKPWFSPSKSFIDVSTVAPVICNSEHSLHVHYTVSSFNSTTPTFYYVVESRGDLLQIGSLIPNTEKELVSKVLVGFPPARAFILRLVITPQMAPESRIIVYYVRSDGEIVAASTVLPVDKCFPNKVRVRWSEKEVQPGANVSLSVRAQPLSLCAINIIDSLLADNNYNKSFVSGTIWEKLEYYKTPFLTETTDYCKLPIVNDALQSANDFLTASNDDLRRKRSYLLPSEFEHVDAITAFNDVGVAVLTDLTLETRPCPNESSYKSSFFARSSPSNRDRYGPYPLTMSFNTDNKIDKNNKDSPKSVEYSKRNNIRVFFPEAWLWSIVTINDNGELIMDLNAPHSITSWDANVFCINDHVGFGMSDPISLVTFLPFFLMVNVPKSYIRTETILVNVTVYNYLGHTLPVKISFKTSDGLEVINQREITDCISELSPTSFNFTVNAIKLGSSNITIIVEVLAALDNCRPAVYEGLSDTVVKSIKVLAEGFQVTDSHSALLCGNDDLKSPWNLSLPHNIIQNTATAKLAISPGLLGPALQISWLDTYTSPLEYGSEVGNQIPKCATGLCKMRLGDFLEMPTGCGEQNMIRLAPNIHILHYLDAANIPNSEKLKEEAINNIKKGYQRQLQFKHPDGSFSSFGPKRLLENEESSIWLTAFVTSTFGQASSIITIDNVTQQESLNWIVSKQLENGCFPLVGQVYSRELRGGLQETESTAALTAYIVSSLHNSRLPIPTSIVSNAEFCLSAESTGTDVYSLSLITYAFTIINRNSYKTQHSLLKLMNLARRDQDFVWWEKPGGSLALSIEMTGYAILSLLQVGGSNNLVTAQSAVRWISTNRNYKGGFISTQDTVIGLEALTKFAIAYPTGPVTSLFVNVIENENKQNGRHTFMIENNNRDVQQVAKIETLPSIINVQTRGEGCTLVQAVLKYNVDKIDGGGFDISANTSTISLVDECYFQNLLVCVKYTIPGATSNMVIVVINVVTGYKPYHDSLTKMADVERWEEDVEENKLIVYLEKVESTPKCFQFLLQKLFIVNHPAPGIVTVTDYYHPEYTKATNYTITCNETPLLFDSPDEESPRRNLENFGNVDFELEFPEGNEVPARSYSCPDNNPNCQFPTNLTSSSTNTIY